ncbi:hypothetical protein HPP92_002844 [Vanilla planifolia]|uniref:N-terminal acetyltransferase B complex auxiliary subunit NAA25 n=1 Tax=Vanilla planifolia TaxID=51239 RepID=A0A835SFD3_VANPL|nr:hypothetical protein HPP92_003240 [Vanilla planifolia]KAG0502772.1 hypothetical protein HPP92_002844 [Vanilla planifolia]
MASKLGLAGGIPERRVRPIWDAVDSRQFKTAFKLSAALLSKYPNSPYALALKALILERTGKLDEALSVCLEARELLRSNNVEIIHIDDLTLSTLQIVFQRLDRLDLATSCYEHACVKFPNNLEVLIGLFNCYVREYSFVKQQQTAIKMYKIVAEERFLLWAICSIQLQVLSPGGEKLLPLAEALVKKHIASQSLHEPEAVVMYISILEQQQKYEEALEVLSGDLGSLIAIEADKLRMQGRLLIRACNYTAAAEIYQKILHSCPDDWTSFCNYLGCLLETELSSSASSSNLLCTLENVELLGCKSNNLSIEVFDSRIESALSFVQKLQMEAHDGQTRCPYLAAIELERQRRMKGRVNDKLMEALLIYFNRFGHLSCFASDVESFFLSLTEKEQAEILERFIINCESSTSEPLNKMGQAITIFKLKGRYGVMTTVPIEELEDTAIKMVDMYCKNLGLSRDLDPQENFYGEDLLHMASNVLLLLYWRTGCFAYLVEALLVLEFGLHVRKYVWQYKLALVHLYSYICALPLAYEWYATLDIKNILLETSSHHILPQLFVSPLWAETSALLKDYLKFMDDYLREASDLTFLAYRHRNYSKVVEFVQFKERLEHSNQYLSARIQYWILQLKQKMDSIDQTECILGQLNDGVQLLELSNEVKLNHLTFNEELQLRPWWSPTSHVNLLLEPFKGILACSLENLHQAGENEDIVRKAIKMKSLVPRLIYLSIQSAATGLREVVEPNCSAGAAKIDKELMFLLDEYARTIDLSFDDAVNLIYAISKGHRSFKEFGTGTVVDCLNFAVFLNAWNFCSNHLWQLHQDGEKQMSWSMVESLIKICIEEQLMCLRPIFESPGSNLPSLVQLITESFGYHALVIQSFLRSIFPLGKKKKKGSSTDNLNLRHLPAINSTIECLCVGIQGVQKWLDDQINEAEDTKLDILLSQVMRKTHDQGPGRVLCILEDNASSCHAELGERISGALQTWSSADVIRKVLRSQVSLMSEFYGICDSKLKMLESLKRSL